MAKTSAPGHRPVVWACSCGVIYEAVIAPDTEAQFRRAWEAVHQGPGHEAVPAEKVLKLRLRQLAEYEAIFCPKGTA